MRPLFTPFNPLYREGEWGLFFKALALMNKILKFNAQGSNAIASDDLITWFKNLGFLEDEDFIKACEPYKSSGFIRAKLWRVYTYCWAVKQSPRAGTKIDLGCYDAKVVDIAQRYVPGMTWAVFDRFEGEKEKHGADLCEKVLHRLTEDTLVIPGDLPDTIDRFRDWRFKDIGFIHVDLNNGKTEVECLERLWPNVMSGGIIILDDFGWSLYKESQELHKAFFRKHGHEVLEVPTGVGMVVKRG